LWIVLALLLSGGSALAEETEYAVAPDSKERDPSQGDGLAAAKGLQVAFRAGVLFPIGSASGAQGDRLAARFAWQPGLVIDAGFRFARYFFAGAYLGASYGDTGNDRVDYLCSMWSNGTCRAYTWRVGVEGIYYLWPDRHATPWMSYGIGLESGNESLKRYEHSESVSSLGLTFAQLSGGFDNRASGMGLFAEVALGEYLHTSTDLGEHEYGYAIEHRRVHAWLMLGGRVVINP
jgi:hypothetical protein